MVEDCIYRQKVIQTYTHANEYNYRRSKRIQQQSRYESSITCIAYIVSKVCVYDSKAYRLDVSVILLVRMKQQHTLCLRASMFLLFSLYFVVFAVEIVQTAFES